MTEAAEAFDRVPVIVSFAEQVKMTETYGFAGSTGKTFLEGQRLVPRSSPSDTLYLFMHPPGYGLVDQGSRPPVRSG